MTPAARRTLADKALFLGPAAVLLTLFFLAPIVVNVFVAFSDMSQTVRFEGFPTAAQFNKLGHLDPDALLGIDLRTSFYGALTLVFVVLTLGIFNVTFALMLALATTAIPPRLGAFFRAVWLLPQMSPSVVYALLWPWVIDSSERGLFNQIVTAAGFPQMNLKLDHPMAVIVVANGLIGASLGMIAVGVFSFIKGWEEYVFVTGLRTGNSYWVMSTYLYYVRDDVMGVDYGLVAAVALIYVLPSLLLYLFAQKYLTQMTLGGVKG